MKKGELMTGQIVSFILLIVSFIIILYVFSLIYSKDIIDDTACHESVVLRATAIASTTKVLGGLAPLQCKTDKICLGGDCKEFEGAENVLNIKDIEENRDIEKVVAQEMVDCWTMMGEGKVSVFSESISESYKFSNVKSDCVICSRIAISDNIDEKIINDTNPMDYMFKHKVPGLEVSYYEFFSGDSSGATIQDEFMKEGAVGDNYKEVAVVFMQAEADDDFADVLKNDLFTALGVGIVANKAGGPFIARTALSVFKGTAGGIATILGASAVVGFQAYNVYNNKEIIAGYCGDISLGEKKGCSVVRVIPYDVKNLKNYCGYVESIS